MFADKIKANKKALNVALICGFIVASATVAMASGEGHHVESGVLLKDFLYRVFNFGLTLAILVYFVSKPLKNALTARRESIATSLKAAQEDAANAEAKYKEYDAKVAGAQQEIEAIKSAIKLEAEKEKARIIAEAQAMAEKIKQEAENASANEIAKGRLVLQQEAVTMAVAMAEDILKKKISKEDQARLVKEYQLKVGDLH